MASLLACTFVLTQLSWIAYSQTLPKYPVTYQMNKSTIIMACNTSGYFSDETVKKLARFGLVDIDWSNAKLLWSNASPMDDQERLLTQAKAIKKVDPSTYVWVYRNLAKALPWFTDVREKLEDPAYNSNWFLSFDPAKKPYHVPSCTNYTNSSGTFSKCTTFYHDQLQTPHYPAQCKQECDCGVNLPCGEYVWDHRNVSLQKWLTDVHIMGPSTNNGEDSTGLNNPNIDGFYIDDHWHNTSSTNPKHFCDSGPYGGVTEEDYYCWEDMGLTQQMTTDITDGWHASMTLAEQTIVENNGFVWQLFRTVSSPNKTECTGFLRGEGKNLNRSALMYEYMTLNNTQSQFMVDLAMFLLVRGDYAWLGYNWNGCHDTWVYMDWNEMLDKDYGKPLGAMSEISNGVFERKWSKATVQMDCNQYKPTITVT